MTKQTALVVSGSESALVMVVVNIYQIRYAVHDWLEEGVGGVPHIMQKFSKKNSNRKIILLYLNQNICCGYSNEPSQ